MPALPNGYTAATEMCLGMAGDKQDACDPGLAARQFC